MAQRARESFLDRRGREPWMPAAIREASAQVRDGGTAPLTTIATSALAVLLIGTIAVFALFGERVAPGVQALGADVGGSSRAEASTVLAQRASAIEKARLTVRADEMTWQPTLADVGLRVDVDRLADAAYAIGRESTITARWSAFWRIARGSVAIGAPSVDERQLGRWASAVGATFDRQPTDARVTIGPTGQIELVPDQVGRAIDLDRLRPMLATLPPFWLEMTGAPPESVATLDLPVRRVSARIVAADLAAVSVETARLVSAPRTLRIDDVSVPIEASDLARLISVEQNGAIARPVVDEARLRELLDDVARRVATAPRDAVLRITPDGRVAYQPDQAGRALDRAAAERRLREALVAIPTADATIELPVARIPAKIRDEHLSPVRDAASRILAGPVTLAAGDQSATLAVTDLAATVRLNGLESASPRLDLDLATLRPKVEALASAAELAPTPPRLRIVGGDGDLPSWVVASMPRGGAEAQLEVLAPGKDGRHLDLDRAMTALATSLPAITATNRSLALPIEPIAANTGLDRARFGPLALIDAGTTSYAGSIPARAHNVELAAERLDGTVVPPGTTFSFNRAVGSTSIDAGYQTAWGIMAGEGKNAGPRTVPSVAGGICQVATTLFHAVFWAGYPIEERNTHLYWIPKYGAPPRGLPGLDATVDEAYGVDFKWTNPTDAPVIVQARTDGQRISFGLYGQKPDWTVQVDEPVIDRRVKADTAIVRQPEPTLPVGRTLFVEEARDGFRAAIVRRVTREGAPPRVVRLTGTYQPSHNVILVGTGRG